MSSKVKVIAFYLPQFHPIPENDEWWGKGFTEWTNVASAKPLFKEHYQPRIPADLGFYDLRLSEVRQQQAELAKEAGVTAFCYWHYWFGNGKELLERPFDEVVQSNQPDFPFCLGWANHSWMSKNWNIRKSNVVSKTLMEQNYPGKEDMIQHFYRLLPAFKDSRYLRVHDRLLFLIYDAKRMPDFELFKNTWNELAGLNGLPSFFFIANSENINDLDFGKIKVFDAISLCRISSVLNFERSIFHKIKSFVINQYLSKLFKYPMNVVEYSNAIKAIDTDKFELPTIYPTVVPMWDPSPRRGISSLIYHNSTPALFKKHVKMILNRIKDKPDEDKVIFLKSWNEWAEGNYMEPDLKWGKGYIKALREALDEAAE